MGQHAVNDLPADVKDPSGDPVGRSPRPHRGSMSDLTWTLTLIGGFVLVALLLRLAGHWLDVHDEDPAARRILPPR